MSSIATQLRFGLARWLVKAGGLSIVPSWARAHVLDYGFAALTKEGYRKNAVVFACISALAFDFPEPPMFVYGDEEEDSESLPKHPLRRLLRRPNPLMGERELKMYTMVYAALGGNAYWHQVRNARGQVVELWPYHAAQIEPEASDDPNAGWVKQYWYDPGDGRRVAIPPDDIVHFKWPSVQVGAPWLAQPPLHAVAAEVDADNELTLYLRSLMLNDAVPRTIISQNPQRLMDQNEIDRAKAQYAANYGGHNRGGVLILEAGATVQRLGLNLQELAFDALHRVPEKRIAAAFRVPLSVAGIGDDPTYSNSEEAYRRYVRSTLAPLWALWGDEVQNSLGDGFGVVVRHDLSQVQALQEDQTAVWARVNSAFTAGRLTINEANHLCGLPAVPGGDTYLWTASMVPVAAMSLGALAEAEAQAALAPPAPVPAQLTGPTDDEIAGEVVDDDDGGAQPDALQQRSAAHIGVERKANAERAARRSARALQRIRKRIAPRVERALNEYFEDLADAIVARAENAAKADLPTLSQLYLESDGIKLVDLVTRYYVEIAAASWETWNEALGIEIAFELSDPAVVGALANAGSQVKLIEETTRSAITDLLVYGAEQGWSIDQLVRGSEDRPGLRALVEQTYKGRARTIARTELGTAQQQVALGRYKAAQMSRVYVLDNGFDDSDPTCTELNGTVQSLDWAQRNLLQHPNCVRCFSPYFEE